MANANILIVEDDAIVAKDIQRKLISLGFEVAALAPSGEEAIAQAEEKKPDLVLMDIVLRGEMDGVETAEQIRSRFNIPIVYLTAYADDEVLERTKTTEPFGYIIKPFEIRELNVAITIALYKHKMETELKENREWLSTTLKSIGDAVIATNKEGDVVFMNPVAEALTGWKYSEANGHHINDVFKIINSKTREKAVNPIEKVLREGAKFGLANHTLLIARDGMEYQIADSAAPIYGSDGTVRGVVLVFRNITREYEYRETLKESEERFRMLGEFASDLIYEWNLITNELQWFGNVHELLGHKPANLAEWDDALHPDDRERAESSVRKVLANKGGKFDMKYRIRRQDGKFLTWIDRGGVIQDEKGEPIRWVGACTDITQKMHVEEEKKRLQESLNRAKKMETIGLLAGGVAHDLNNILSGIVGYPQVILMDDNLDPQIRKSLEIIEDSGKKAASVVADLIAVVKGAASDKKIINLNNIVNDYLSSPEYLKLTHTYSYIKMKKDFDPDLLNIKCSHIHISKVVMNLVINAAEAVSGNGIIIISTRNKYLDKPFRGYENINTGEYAVLTVSDNGSGISPQDIERIFEPFYTKKVMGRSGTGLGLTIVWNTLQDHDGYINVISDDNGTTFELYLPITREKIIEKDISIPIESYKGRGEKILVVDDVASQREIARSMLDALGYRTTAVSSGEEAVEYLKEYSVDIILLDMIMDPGINGRETYELISKIHPNQKAVIASGYAETAEVKKAQKLGAGKFVRKPYTLEKIGKVVKEELEK